MKKGDTLEGLVERIEFPNKGIVTVEDRQVVVKNALPGQRVRFTVNKMRHGKAEGRLLAVVEKSPDETQQACPHFGVCGGCLYQGLQYERQLAIKEEQVKALMSAGGHGERLDFYEGMLASPRAEGYRNKMEFSFGDEVKDGPLALGMHKRGSFYDIVSVSECRLVDGDFRLLLQETLSFFREEGAPFFHKLSHQGYLRHLLVRKAVKTGEILLALVTSSQCELLKRPEEEMLSAYAERICGLRLEGKLTGVLHVQNDSLADMVRNDGTRILYGRDYFYEELLGLSFRISPFSFFQTNSLGAEVLYEKTREYIGDMSGKLVFDLYSGTGTIAQLLASVAKKVVGVEIVEEAVAAARENARGNGLDNVEFLAGDVLKVLDAIPERPDFIVLDPPRDGVHPKALPKIIDYGVENIVYISCKPTSLVRDLAVLEEKGYRLKRWCCVDMFAGTGGVETCILLSHKNS